jgi:hypothetical protein
MEIRGSTSNLESACKNLGGLGPLVWEEIENEQTVHKGLVKLLFLVLLCRHRYFLLLSFADKYLQTKVEHLALRLIVCWTI